MAMPRRPNVHALCAFLLLPVLGPTASAQSVRVNPPLPRDPGFTAEDVFSFLASPDGRWAVFLADPEQDDRFELFSAPADGSGPPRRLDEAYELFVSELEPARVRPRRLR